MSVYTIGSLLLLSCTQSGRAAEQAALSGAKVQPGAKFDYLMFAQVWPESICTVANEKEKGSCLVPGRVSGWTIHGVWPSSFTGEGPEYCKSPDRHFNVSKIKKLEDKLEIHWPNLLPNKGLTSLWKHEWEKHGSCAESVKSMEGEDNYFAQGLLQNSVHNISKIFNDGSILPGDEKGYGLQEYLDALKKASGKNILLHCLVDHNKNWYISSVRICMNKELAPIDCPEKIHSMPAHLIESPAMPIVEPCPKGIFRNHPVSTQC